MFKISPTEIFSLLVLREGKNDLQEEDQELIERIIKVVSDKEKYEKMNFDEISQFLLSGLQPSVYRRAELIIQLSVQLDSQTELHERVLRAIEELRVEPSKDNRVIRMSILNLFVREISLRIQELEFKDLCLIF